MKLLSALKSARASVKIAFGIGAIVVGALIMAGTLGWGLPLAVGSFAVGGAVLATGIIDVVHAVKKQKTWIISNPLDDEKPLHFIKSPEQRRKGDKTPIPSDLGFTPRRTGSTSPTRRDIREVSEPSNNDVTDLSTPPKNKL
jgi:hypothetical protein